MINFVLLGLGEVSDRSPCLYFLSLFFSDEVDVEVFFLSAASDVEVSPFSLSSIREPGVAVGDFLRLSVT